MKGRVALGLAVLLAGCEAVPALTFTDASAEGQDAATDAGGDVERDVGAIDGSSADALSDAVEQNTCPTVTPPATLCCSNGLQPCVGCQNQGDCQRCAGVPCSANQVCCIRAPSTASCVELGVVCPP